MKCQEWLNWPILYFDMIVVVCLMFSLIKTKIKKQSKTQMLATLVLFKAESRASMSLVI
jgi:hypothetical protein